MDCFDDHFSKAMAKVNLKGVCKVYDDGSKAVRDATFEVENGEFVVLVGPSGCGKSTTLRMIAGLESITSGTMHIGERLVNDVPPKDRDTAMVFQNYALYPHMTVFENMAFGLKLRKFSKKDIRKQVSHAAEILGIEAILDRRPKQLSGGQRQRVAVGRAIVRNPKVFLFVEPLSNLDARLRVQMRAEIVKLQRRLGATTIYVTHDQVEAMTMGDRIVVMAEGRIQQIDTPLNLYNEPANRFVAGFIGSPAMNFIPGRIDRDESPRFEAAGREFSFDLPEEMGSLVAGYEGRAVILGVRPEDLYSVGEGHLANPAAIVDGMLDMVEPMGNEIVLYAHAGEHHLVARVAPQPLPVPDRPVQLTVDLRKLHFFDEETGKSIGWRAPSSREPNENNYSRHP